MAEDEFDYLPDLFAGVTEDEWSRLLDHPAPSPEETDVPVQPPQQVVAPPTPPAGGSSTSSTEYGEESSFMDPDILAEIDQIEAQALQRQGVESSLTATHGIATIQSPLSQRGESCSDPQTFTLDIYRCTNKVLRRYGTSRPIEINHQWRSSSYSHYSRLLRDIDTEPENFVSESRRPQLSSDIPDTNPVSSCVPSKRPRKEEPIITQKQKGKLRDDETVRQLMHGYEEELSCPICCDLFVVTHVANPCGHSLCGDCGWLWIKTNRHNHCPVCRTQLFRGKPLIPNIAMDSLIEKHIQHLAIAGDDGWQPHGSKYKERASRQEKWRAAAASRKNEKQKRKLHVRPILINEIPEEVLFIPNDDSGESYVDQDQSREQIREPDRHARHHSRNSRRRRR